MRGKGHWVLTDVEGNKVWHCNCSECGKDPQDYIGGSEDWWLIKNNLPNFCPTCGSDNRAVVIKRNLCDSCVTKGCIFQSGIVRNHCDFYKAESEDKE